MKWTRYSQYIILISIIIAILLIYFYSIYFTPGYLTFSDAAKYADVARNIVQTRSFGSNFSFYARGFPSLENGLFNTTILPVYPVIISSIFKLFGISDFSVILTSGVLYIGIIILTYFIASKIFGDLVAFLSALAVSVNVNILDYASNGASEMIFIFEILLITYLILMKRKWTSYFAFITLILLYLTRPQAPIYIVGLWIFYLLVNFDTKKRLFKALIISIFIGLLLELLSQRLSGNFFLYSTLVRGLSSSIQYSSILPANESLRIQIDDRLSLALSNLVPIAKKTFYNLYNFYRLLPQIASPYMWGLFVIGLFKWRKNKAENSLKAATIFMIFATFFATALTIPFFRYLHPVVPLVYLFATATLVWIVRSMVNGQWLMVKKWPFVKKLSKEKFIILTSSFLILFFVVGQTLGVIFLDSRFEAARTNRGNPPVYVVLSKILKENTNPEDIVVTNLDTWGSWYGERRTIWFPLTPEQLIPPGGEDIAFDAIYLTSYLIDDENYYMGEEWRQIFNNPENSANEFIARNYELKGAYQISAEETYEKQGARSVLLVKKAD